MRCKQLLYFFSDSMRLDILLLLLDLTRAPELTGKVLHSYETATTNCRLKNQGKHKDLTLHILYIY